MAASLMLRRELCSLARIIRGISRLEPRALSARSGHGICDIIRSHLPLTSSTSFHTATALLKTSPSITITDEPDELLQKVSLLVKGHDRAVLDSYEFFVTTAAKELGITISNVHEPPKDKERITLLKSIHIFNKHRAQYETRTHYRCIEFSHMTGCTAQVYLEYVERNLPEGGRPPWRRSQITYLNPCGTTTSPASDLPIGRLSSLGERDDMENSNGDGNITSYGIS